MIRTLAYWGKENPWKTRFLLVLLHTIVMSLFIVVGLMMNAVYQFNASAIIPWLVVAYILLVAVYPIKQSLFSFYRASFMRRKLTDGLLIALSCMFMFSAGTQLESYFEPTTTEGIQEVEYVKGVMGGKLSKKSIKEWSSIKNFKVKWKTLKGEVKELIVQAKAKSLNFHHWAWFLLLSLVVTILFFLLAIFSCNLSCSGMEMAAGVVLFGGLALIITGIVFAIRAILRSEKLRAKGKKNKTS